VEEYEADLELVDFYDNMFDVLCDAVNIPEDLLPFNKSSGNYNEEVE